MKKRKIYEISVIDKTYSKTIYDETKFYTSDTALELVFKLKETEYTFESAEIVLLNIDDRSLVTRPVSKVNNDFVYELDDDIIPHYGEWRGQLRFEAGETYVSSPVKFRIENDLSNDRPPQLSDVQSWVSLKRYADSLTEELKQAVLSIEGVEDTFNENELERQTTFETNESERAETFESNEATRQTQELEREGAEGQRQTAFDNNEANRTETFNANEATRKANEESRELAENERENAEVHRKIDHENRSAELAIKADKVVIKNLIKNGDFSHGLEGWNDVGRGTLEVVENKLKVTSNANVDNSWVRYMFYGKYNNVYYATAKGRTYSSQNEVKLENYNGHEEFVPLDGKASVRAETSGANNSVQFIIRQRHSPQEPGEMIIDYMIALDLTAIFGAGNEPTKEEMDELIETIGYIDGEYALNNKEMLIWTLAMTRRNKNAIVALGGTI